jgi:hypothetical protein
MWREVESRVFAMIPEKLVAKGSDKAPICLLFTKLWVLDGNDDSENM